MLGELLKLKNTSIAVSGTHGKTSTTSMMGSILTEGFVLSNISCRWSS